MAQIEEREQLALKRAEQDAIARIIDGADRRTTERAAAIKQARLDLQREEAIASTRALVGAVELGREVLMEEFGKRAAGKLWYEGTGNDDSILEHQWHGMMFGAVARRWILGDYPGLGKTRTSVGWLDLIGAQRIIIVCQPDICDQFAGEVMTLAPHRTLTNLYHRTPADRHAQLDAATALPEGVIVVNFEMWRRDKDALAKLMNWQADTVIVDEAHNIKNKRTTNYKTIELLITVDNTCRGCGAHMKGLYEAEALLRTPPRKVAQPCGACGWKLGDTSEKFGNALERWTSTKSVKNTLFMTGTPILNDPADLFPLLHLCDPILFTTENSFRDAYCRKDHHADKWEFRAHAVENLKPLIEGRFLARTYEDAGIVLPEQHVRIIPTPLDPALYPLQLRTIKQISKQAQIMLDSGDSTTIMHLIALITRKRQANVWPGGITVKDEEGNIVFDAGTEVNESVKLDRIMEKALAKHEDGHRQVVFSQFKTALAELEKRFTAQGLRVVRLDGDTPEALRKRIKTNFYRAANEVPEWDILLANYKTGGTGLNLTSATVMHILDEEWSPGKRDQAYGRTHRVGQVDETEVYVYRIPGSIDTWMSNGIHRKEMMIEGFTEVMTSADDHEIDASTLLDAIKNGDVL